MVYDKSGSDALPMPTKDATIDQLATSLRNAGGAMSDTQVVSQTAVVEGWVGESANQYVSDVTTIKDAVSGAQGNIDSAAQAMDTYQTEFNNLKTKITAHQTTWDEDLKWYKDEVKKQEDDRENARNQAVRDSPGEKFDSSSWDTNIANLKTKIEEKQKERAKLYNTDVEAVDSAASTAASSISTALEAYIPGISSGSAPAKLPSRSDLGAQIFGDGDGILAAQTHWDNALEDAPEAARILDQIDPKTGLPTEAALKEFNEKYGDRLATDPYFASAFLNKFGPEKLYDFASRAADDNVPKDRISSLKEFVENAGAGIILATGGSSSENTGLTTTFNNVDVALLVDGKKHLQNWRSDFQAELISNGEKKYDSEGNVIPDDKVVQNAFRGYELLGQYIGYGAKAHPELSLGYDFLNGIEGKNPVGMAMVKWDAEHPRNFDLINATAQSGPSGSGSIKYNPNGMFHDGLSWDYLQNMFEAMDNAPDDSAAKTFMNSTLSWNDDGDSSTSNKEMNMTRYLVGNRSQFGNITAANFYWADDKGEALGRLIDEISGDTSDPKSVNIASNFLRGYNEGLNRNYDVKYAFGNQDEFQGQDVFGYNNSGLRSHIDDILAEYAGDLAHELDDYSGVPGGPSSSWDPRDGRYHLVLDKELYEQLDADDSKFFKDIGFDKTVLTNFSSETVNQMANEYHSALTATGDTGHLSELRNDIVSDYQGLLQNMDVGEREADVAAGVAKDKQVSTVTGVLKFANEHLTGNIPGAGPYIKEGVGYVLDIKPSSDEARAASEHLSDGAQRDARIQESLNGIRQNVAPGAVDNPIEVHRAPTSPQDSNYLPMMREYNAQLPKNEQFLDENGNIPLNSRGVPEFGSEAKKQAYMRYTLDLWSGQGQSKDTENQ